jgi:TatD DNase family protein
MKDDYWIDTHAHVYSDDLKKDLDEVLNRAHSAGVNKMFMPNIDHTSIDAMLEVEAKSRACFPMMGLHPCSVKKDFEKELYVVEQWLSKRRFLAVGEMGTDLYWDKSFWEQQKEAFVIQVTWAKKYGLPIVIHCRESIDQTIELLGPLVEKNLTGVFHCFSGSEEQARKIVDLGFYLGIGGVATFKNAGLDTVLPKIPLDRIVLETDSPYLAPVPYRGKRNEPSYVPLIANKLTEFLKITMEQLKTATTQNALKIFNIKSDSLN